MLEPTNYETDYSEGATKDKVSLLFRHEQSSVINAYHKRNSVFGWSRDKVRFCLVVDPQHRYGPRHDISQYC